MFTVYLQGTWDDRIMYKRRFKQESKEIISPKMNDPATEVVDCNSIVYCTYIPQLCFIGGQAYLLQLSDIQ